uniref:Putative secreted peptide n=1 Tax=Anopheles braziliensis TaxID=58242 RepID=A0A2M3ZN93_9DIPT
MPSSRLTTTTDDAVLMLLSGVLLRCYAKRYPTVHQCNGRIDGPFGWIGARAHLIVFDELQLLGLLDRFNDDANVRRERLYSVERGNQRHRQESFTVHLSSQIKVSVQIILAKVIFNLGFYTLLDA